MDLKLLSRRVKILLSVFLFFGALTVEAQTFVIKGTVSDEFGEPLPGVSISVKNTTRGTTTDADGMFALPDVKMGDKLVFSFIGYETMEVTVNSQENLTINLSEETQQLSEIVVTALGIKKEQRSVGYATQNVKGEQLQKVPVVDVGTSLTGKVAGVLVQNSPNFNNEPRIFIRGEENPLLVVDGIAYANKRLSDIAAQDIESMSVLKGATATALYGYRGEHGAILITTKNGSTGNLGITVDFSTNTMFNAGFLAIPEKQSVYGRGDYGSYSAGQTKSWGPVMDGSIQNQWDPYLKEMRDYEYLPIGKDNFKNFLEQGYITNNNVNVTFKENTVSMRNSVNWTENKARYPNAKVDKFSYLLGGDIFLDKFQLTSNLSYTRRHTPNMGSNGYTSYDPMYTLLLRSSADFDIRDYKDNYWLIPGELQNNMYGFDLVNGYTGQDGNNPYYDRYERINEVTRDIFNADITASYAITDWLKATVRSGLDYFGDRGELRLNKGSYTSLGDTGIPYYSWRSGLTFNGKLTGAYLVGKTTGLSTNSDLLLSGSTKFLDDRLGLEYLAGGSIFYQENGNINALTVGGITVPGYYSLAASVSPATVAEERRAEQTNSLYGRLALSWNNFLYIEATGRNDWTSRLAGPTVQKSDRSYFYPSVAGSLIVSEFLEGLTSSWLDLLKVRASWTQSKTPPGVYAINSVYTSAPSIWNDLSGAYSPDVLWDLNTLRPESRNTTEIGLQGMFLRNRITADISYYSIRKYDTPKPGPLTSASGYNYKYINIDEETTKKGWEIALTGTPVKTADLQWDVAINWSTFKEVYSKIDTVFSTNRPWIKEGERVDAYTMRRFQTVPSGEFAGQRIYQNGKLVRENYSSVIGYKTPDWIWGINTTLRYKNWSLFASFDGVVGGMFSSTTEAYMWIYGVHPGTLTSARAEDVADPAVGHYVGEGAMVVSGNYTTDNITGEVLEDTRVFAANDVNVTYKTYIQSLHGGTAWGGTGYEDDILDRTFFKLREISVTYNFPKRLLQSWGPIQTASVSFIGQNVFLWAKEFKYSDPDGGSENLADPSSRYIGANIKLSF
ncbi:MAG: SusC/RagA family TonB-linked outer membrane protein [Cyclobacteriaceae bacterium]|nr:SusC/RagA family TonB-linked outer membrane protein [Cyclobacteriaceae bacterium]